MSFCVTDNSLDDVSFFTETLTKSQDVNPISASLVSGNAATATLAAMAVDEVEKMNKKTTRSARLYEKSRMLHKQVTDGPSEAIFNRIVKEGHEELVRYQQEKAEKSKGHTRRNPGDVATLPQTNQRSVARRLAPACSPSKHKRRQL